MPIQSLDLTTMILYFTERHVIIISIYMEPKEVEELKESLELLDNAIKKTREKIGQQIEIIFVGDFNRHDEFWGDNDTRVR